MPNLIPSLKGVYLMRFVLFVFLFPWIATADPDRPIIRFSEDYSCTQIQNIVNHAGEALIYSHGRYNPVEIYDVAYSIGCPYTGYKSAPFWVRSKDVADCFAGYRCEQNDRH